MRTGPDDQPVAQRRVGRGAVLLEVAGPAEALSLAAHLRGRAVAGEVVPGACTVLLHDVGDLVAVDRALAGWAPGAAGDPGPLVELTTTYDGPDLEAVAGHWGVPVEEVVARHAATEFTSAFCGFAPGFAYLAGLPEELAVPRLASPRPRVAPGSVGLAGAWCGVYPTASPGGWLLLGRTAEPLWDVDRDPPALLAPGTGVRFLPA